MNDRIDPASIRRANWPHESPPFGHTWEEGGTCSEPLLCKLLRDVLLSVASHQTLPLECQASDACVPHVPYSIAFAAPTGDGPALHAMLITWGSPASLKSWSSSNPCDGSWKGITCAGGAVTGIALKATPMNRPLSPAVGNITSLVSLKLQSLGLTGQLPITLSLLTNLETLLLSQNQLSGSVPPQLSSLAALQLFSLRGNQLTGTLPSVIWDSTPELAEESYDVSNNPGLCGNADYLPYSCTVGTHLGQACPMPPGEYPPMSSSGS